MGRPRRLNTAANNKPPRPTRLHATISAASRRATRRSNSSDTSRPGSRSSTSGPGTGTGPLCCGAISLPLPLPPAEGKPRGSSASAGSDGGGIGGEVIAVDSGQSAYRTQWISDTVIADGIQWLREQRQGGTGDVLLLVYPIVGGDEFRERESSKLTAATSSPMLSGRSVGMDTRRSGIGLWTSGWMA
jgi:hypothetical protein